MESEFDRGMNAAYRLLSYRDRAEKEIRTALKKKEFGQEAINRVVKALEDKGYLNDTKFAFSFGRSIAQRRRVGPRYVYNHLLKKGVNRETASDALEKIFGDSVETEKEIDGWIEKKLARGKSDMEPIKRKKKIYDFLLRKGFNSEDVFKAMEKWKI